MKGILWGFVTVVLIMTAGLLLGVEPSVREILLMAGAYYVADIVNDLVQMSGDRKIGE